VLFLSCFFRQSPPGKGQCWSPIRRSKGDVVVGGGCWRGGRV
jgi:hypothetical protein